VLHFIIPILIGIVVQTVFYGVSTIPPFVAVSVCCMINSLQNECVYRDSLTGLYNRTYLDYLKWESGKKKSGVMTAIMIDLNDFKSINDEFGHSVGDEALIDIATILRTEIGDFGSVIRYAGDEFVVLINTDKEDQVHQYLDGIKDRTDRFNIEASRKYKLSFAVGYWNVDLKNNTIDELLGEVDHRMYQDKEAYYQLNPQMDRRKS